MNAVRTCACCNLPKTIFMDSPTAQQVCNDCKAHHGRDYQWIDRLHVSWWRKFAFERESLLRSKVAELKKLRSELDDLTASALDAYATAPDGRWQWLQNDLVRDAENRRDAAYRARDRALSALMSLDILHNDRRKAGWCSCGKSAKVCHEYGLITSVDKLLTQWETRQLDRLHDGKDHWLPDSHPVVIRTGNKSRLLATQHWMSLTA